MRHLLYQLIAMEVMKETWNADNIKRLEDLLPSGSGIDSGTQISVSSTGKKIILETSYHHMNDGGYYNGWTDHTVVVTPAFLFGIDVVIKGRNRNDIKDYLGEVYQEVLCREVEYSFNKEDRTFNYEFVPHTSNGQ